MTGPADLSLRGMVRMALLAACGLLAVFIEAAPLGLTATARPSPDLLFCILAIWALRRPDTVPVLLVFALGLTRDLLTDLPPGLGAVTLVFAIEALKLRRAPLARQGFIVELLLIATVFAAMLAGQWLGVLVALAQPPYLILILQQYTVTLLVYPVLVALIRVVFQLRWQQPKAPAV